MDSSGLLESNVRIDHTHWWYIQVLFSEQALARTPQLETNTQRQNYMMMAIINH